MSESVRISDRYEVEAVLGSGASGTVSLAHDLATGEKVAIKKIHQGGSAGSKVALHEISAILGLNHHRIVRCLDFCYLGSEGLYIVYELVSGGTLRKLIEEKPRWETTEALQCVRQILEGLAYLHSNELIHCDLKPENIFCSKTAEGIVYKIGDLGVSHTVAQIQSHPNVAGTPAYQSPERPRNPFGPNSDLYSLGIILYEMLVGRLPYMGSAAEIARAHARMKPDVSTLADPRLRDLINTLLEKDPRFRVTYAEEVIRMVDSILASPASLGIALRPNEVRGTMAPFPLNGLSTIWEVPLRPDHCHALLTPAGVPILAVEHEGRLSLFDGPTGNPLNFAVPSVGMAVQPCGASVLAYSTKTRVCALDMARGQEETLLSDAPRVFGLHYVPQPRLLVWADSREVRYIEFTTARAGSFHCPNFGLNTFVRGDSLGAVLYASGPVNPRIHIAVVGDTSTPGYVDLQGPVVGLSQGVDGCYLILTLSSSHSERFVLEHLDIKDGSRQTELLPGDIESYSFAGGDLILLFKDGSLMRCRHECSPAYLFPAPRSESPRLIAATPGGNFLFVVVEERNRTRVHLFAQTP